MIEVSMPEEFQRMCEDLRAEGKSIGLVPTMGALHHGHGELIRAARGQCDIVALSIFVNPLQFDNPEDLAKYPSNYELDVAFARKLGVDIIFAPPQDAMHPKPILVRVQVERLSDILEGASRPGHFGGVATVVTKLFVLVGRCKAYFGEKDFQQLAIVERLSKELHLPVEIVPVPIVRDPSGLALSSRNQRLSESQLVVATALSRALFAGKKAIEDGVRDPKIIESIMREEVRRPVGSIDTSDYPVLDYALVVDQRSLTQIDRIESSVRLVIAAFVGTIRLIDNIGVDLA